MIAKPAPDHLRVAYSRNVSGEAGLLKSAGGDGTSGGMDQLERRVIVLEEGFKRFSADMGDLLKEMRALRADMAELKGRVSTLPTTLQTLAFAIAILAAAGLTRWATS